MQSVARAESPHANRILGVKTAENYATGFRAYVGSSGISLSSNNPIHHYEASLFTSASRTRPPPAQFRFACCRDTTPSHGSIRHQCPLLAVDEAIWAMLVRLQSNKSQNRRCGWFRRLKRNTIPPENPKDAGALKRCGAGVPPEGCPGVSPGGAAHPGRGTPPKPAGRTPALRSGPQPCEGRNPSTLRSSATEDGKSERGPHPGFQVCAPSPSKRHTLIQAGPPHPKSGNCLRKCGGCISRTAVDSKMLERM